jgi:hypothetical protein
MLLYWREMCRLKMQKKVEKKMIYLRCNGGLDESRVDLF